MGNSNKNPSGSKSAVPAKAKGNPRKDSNLNDTSKYDHSGRQKEVNS